jgi:hypothetical protein
LKETKLLIVNSISLSAPIEKSRSLSIVFASFIWLLHLSIYILHYTAEVDKCIE